jgi:hypothetical protein
MLYLECLAQSIMAKRPDWVGIPVSSIADGLLTAPHQAVPAAILFCAANSRGHRYPATAGAPFGSPELASNRGLGGAGELQAVSQ